MGNPEFVEVKFRWNSRATKEDAARLKNIHKFWNAKLVLVNCWEQPYFRSAEPPYVNSGGEFVTRPLVQEKNWSIRKDAYEECEALVHKYLSPTLIPGKK